MRCSGNEIIALPSGVDWSLRACRDGGGGGGGGGDGSCCPDMMTYTCMALELSDARVPAGMYFGGGIWLVFAPCVMQARRFVLVDVIVGVIAYKRQTDKRGQ